MRKGFTLIELLAVIVILAIIASIATPIILNIISDSKEAASLRSAEMYYKSVQYSVALAIKNNKNISDEPLKIKDGDICLDDSCSKKIEVEVKGKAPETGTIIIKDEQIATLNIVIDDKQIARNSDGEFVLLKKLEDVCEHVSGTPKTAGAKYECEVDPDGSVYTFYILNTLNSSGEIITDNSAETAVSVNLIMDRNICQDGTPTYAGKTDKCLVAWCSDESSCKINGEWSNTKGPITAMNYLYNATKTWTNVNKIVVDSFNSYDSNVVLIKTTKMEKYKTYARMPYYNELKELEGTYLYENLASTTSWLNGNVTKPTKNIGNIWAYWTLTSVPNSTKFAYRLSYNGTMPSDTNFYESGKAGVRPVINLQI